MTSGLAWRRVRGQELQQGDFLPDCRIPRFRADLALVDTSAIWELSQLVEVPQHDVVVITQSCDLANQKTPWVAVCAAYSTVDFEEANPNFGSSGKLKRALRGDVRALQLLPFPGNEAEHLVVDFRQLFSLPSGYIKEFAASLGLRYRLAASTPYREGLSSAFGYYFSRVALPERQP